jgi:hypothetical protein
MSLDTSAPDGGAAPTVCLVVAGNVFTFDLVDVNAVDGDPTEYVRTGADGSVVINDGLYLWTYAFPQLTL